MARGGLSRHFLFVTVVLLLAGVGLWVTCRHDRGASSAASPVTAPAVPSANSAQSEENVPASTARSVSEAAPADADEAQAPEPNDGWGGETEGLDSTIFPAGAPAEGPLDPGYMIRGRVVSPEGPIREEPGQWPRTFAVRVDAPGYARECELDEEGRFECAGLDAGTYIVSVAGPSPNPRVHNSLLCEALQVTLGPLSPLAECVLTMGQEVPVAVVVLEQDSFLPRADETVIARSVSGVSELGAGTDDQGCCVLGLIPGRYWIETRPGEGRQSESISQLVVVSPDAQDLSVQLFVPAREEKMVRFFLVDSRGDPVKGYVGLDSADPGPDRQPADTIVIPDPGHRGFGRVVGYAHDVSGELARYFTCSEEARSDGMTVVLEPRARIVGRLLSVDGLPATDARLDLQLFLPEERWLAADPSLHKLAADGEGHFQFDGVPVGLDVRVIATVGPYQADSGPLALKPGGTHDLGDIRLKPPESAPATGSVHGRMIDEKGQTLSDRAIWTSSGGEWTRTFLRQGQFVAGGVPVGQPATIWVAIPGSGGAPRSPWQATGTAYSRWIRREGDCSASRRRRWS